jgi:hypothetical protein
MAAGLNLNVAVEKHEAERHGFKRQQHGSDNVEVTIHFHVGNNNNKHISYT